MERLWRLVPAAVQHGCGLGKAGAYAPIAARPANADGCLRRSVFQIGRGQAIQHIGGQTGGGDGMTQAVFMQLLEPVQNAGQMGGADRETNLPLADAAELAVGKAGQCQRGLASQECPCSGIGAGGFHGMVIYRSVTF